jgi:putative PIN family toxin of toxin-antitoxin system
MRTSERYVFDTNVLVSALLHSLGKPRQVFDIALRNGQILTSLVMLRKLDAVLSRPKFDRYLLREERERFLQAFIREAALVEVTERLDVCRDPKDNAVLELALGGGATLIVTGDEDLLVLHPFREVSIMTPDKFLEYLQGT